MGVTYHLVWHRNKPISLVKIVGDKARLIAGLDSGLRYFRGGEIDLNGIDIPVCIQLIASKPWHPDLSVWIERCFKLASRKKMKRLSKVEQLAAVRLRNQGVRVSNLAARFGVSASTIKRLTRPNS
jgi:hypothetical protein